MAEATDPKAWAVFRPATEKHDIWSGMIGSDAIPLLSPRAELVEIECVGLVPAFLVDLLALPPRAFSRMVRWFAARHGVEPRVVQAEFLANGLPLRTDDVFACADPEEGRRFWRGEAASG